MPAQYSIRYDRSGSVSACKKGPPWAAPPFFGLTGSKTVSYWTMAAPGDRLSSNPDLKSRPGSCHTKPFDSDSAVGSSFDPGKSCSNRGTGGVTRAKSNRIASHHRTTSRRQLCSHQIPCLRGLVPGATDHPTLPFCDSDCWLSKEYPLPS